MAHRSFDGKEHATSYHRYRVTHQELIDEVLAFLERRRQKPFDLAVDVGCGSGQGTVLLAPHFTHVVGTDISPTQLEVALTNSHTPNVSYRQCPAEEMPLEDGVADLVTAMTAAHWFDVPRFLLEADRLLRPGGCLALLSYTLDMELECGESTAKLNHICSEFYAALLPYRSAHLGPSSVQLYKQIYESIPYKDKEWHECLRVRKQMPLASYVGMVETFSNYQGLLKKDPPEAFRLSQDITDRLLRVIGVSSPAIEVVVVVKYFYLLACKPSTD